MSSSQPTFPLYHQPPVMPPPPSPILKKKNSPLRRDQNIKKNITIDPRFLHKQASKKPSSTSPSKERRRLLSSTKQKSAVIPPNNNFDMSDHVSQARHWNMDSSSSYTSPPSKKKKKIIITFITCIASSLTSFSLSSTSPSNAR